MYSRIPSESSVCFAADFGLELRKHPFDGLIDVREALERMQYTRVFGLIYRGCRSRCRCPNSLPQAPTRSGSNSEVLVHLANRPQFPHPVERCTSRNDYVSRDSQREYYIYTSFVPWWKLIAGSGSALIQFRIGSALTVSGFGRAAYCMLSKAR